MKLIVDANIIFSAILNTNGKIGDLLINSYNLITFVSPDFLRSEIRKHHSKLSLISGLTTNEIIESEFHIYKSLNFISAEQISQESWKFAEDLVKNVDPKDIQYVAFAKELKCKLWSGDKQLIRGLQKKSYNDIISTNQLFELRENLKRSKLRKKSK